MRTGEMYVSSGKFELPKVLTAAFVGIVAASVLGVVYAVISNYNPFIYLNILVLAGLIVALGFIIQKVTLYGKSRNTVVNLIVGLVVCFFSWYAHWCMYCTLFEGSNFFSAFFTPVDVFEYMWILPELRVITVSNRGSGGMEVTGIFLAICYVVEFGAFMFPAFKNTKPVYYSETHNCVYTSLTCYTEKNEYFTEEFGKAMPGCYGFLAKMELYHTTNEIPLEHNSKVIKLEYHYCEEDDDDSILTISDGKLKIDKKKNENTFSGGSKLVKDIYVDKATDEAIMRKNPAPVVSAPAEPVETDKELVAVAEPEEKVTSEADRM